jgi:hypothetical protein
MYMGDGMAKIGDLNVEGWKDWVSGRPGVVRDLCERYPPDRLYLLKTTGQRVTILSYFENGTVRVEVSSDWNLVFFNREVFGIDPSDLEECDLPDENTPVGFWFIGSEDEVKDGSTDVDR